MKQMFFIFFVGLFLATHSIADNLKGMFICNIKSKVGFGVDVVILIETSIAKIKYLGDSDSDYNIFDLIHKGKITQFKTYVQTDNSSDNEGILVMIEAPKDPSGFHFNLIRTSDNDTFAERSVYGTCKKI